MVDDFFGQFLIFIFGVLLVENAEFAFFNSHAPKAVIRGEHALVTVCEAVNSFVASGAEAEIVSVMAALLALVDAFRIIAPAEIIHAVVCMVADAGEPAIATGADFEAIMAILAFVDIVSRHVVVLFADE